MRETGLSKPLYNLTNLRNSAVRKGCDNYLYESVTDFSPTIHTNFNNNSGSALLANIASGSPDTLTTFTRL